MKHLKETNLSYFGHMRGAFKTFWECSLAGAAAFIHGIFPFILETSASDLVRKVYQRQNSK